MRRWLGSSVTPWLVALVLAVVGLLTLGLPGAVLFELFLILVGPDAHDRVPPDSAWPIAIYLSLLAPLGLPLAWHALRRSRRRWRALLVTLAWLGWSLALAALLYSQAL